MHLNTLFPEGEDGRLEILTSEIRLELALLARRMLRAPITHRELAEIYDVLGSVDTVLTHLLAKLRLSEEGIANSRTWLSEGVLK